MHACRAQLHQLCVILIFVNRNNYMTLWSSTSYILFGGAGGLAVKDLGSHEFKSHQCEGFFFPLTKVKVSADVPETIPCDPVGYGGVVKSRISSPIVVDTGKFVEDTKSHVCS